MIQVTIGEAKARFSELLEIVALGNESVLICRRGQPVAELVKPNRAPVRSRARVYPDLKVGIKCDPCAPLDDEAWPADSR